MNSVLVPQREGAGGEPQDAERVLLGVPITPELAGLADAIEISREMLTWGDDWDGEGSPGYLEATWTRAVSGLLRAASGLTQLLPGVLKTPAVYHGPEGSIDVLWEAPGSRLLANVPPVGAGLASYYGKDARSEIQGTFDPENLSRWQMLILW